MVMNKKGQSLFVFLMLGLVVIWLGINLANPFREVNQDSLNQLNCTTVTSYQDKANCVAVDFFTPLLTGTLIGLAGLILARSFL